MPTNDIKPFAAAGGANVLTQAEYLALAALSTGFSSGKASSKEVNKAIRQATFIASVLAQFICDKSGSDVLDDGNVAGLVTKLLSAINKTSQPLDATLTALAGLVGAANKLPYFNGTDTATLTDLTSVGRDIIGKNSIADILTYLGLGDAAKRGVGTGANQIPDMSAWQTGGNTLTGWRKTPDGYIEQWGVSAATATSVDITFPIPFPQGIAQLTEHDSATTGQSMALWQFNAVSNSGATCINIGSITKGNTAVGASVSTTCRWFAKGK